PDDESDDRQGNFGRGPASQNVEGRRQRKANRCSNSRRGGDALRSIERRAPRASRSGAVVQRSKTFPNLHVSSQKLSRSPGRRRRQRAHGASVSIVAPHGGGSW